MSDPTEECKSDGRPETLKVSSRSRPRSVAGALGTVLEREGVVILHAIGAGAVNQTVKAIAIARGYLMPHGLDVVTRISFATLDIDGEERTAMRFTCYSELFDDDLNLNQEMDPK